MSFRSSQESQEIVQQQKRRPSPPPKINEQDLEEILNRNRAVSGSAISRAVSDAASGSCAHPSTK